MNTKNLLLGTFMILTVVFASLTLSEYYQVNMLNSQLGQSKSASTQTLISTTSATSITTITSPVICQSNTTCATFTYSPIGQVQVESVLATQFICQNCGAVNGQSYVSFAVIFENTGNSPIYIPDGSVGVSTAVSPNSILQKVTSRQCAGTYVIAKLNPGQNYTLYGPDCFTGFDYQLVQAGSANVAFSFNWTTNSNASTNPTDFPNSTTISARFIFP